MKLPYVIYADFEALLRKIQLFHQQEGIKTSFTKQMKWHEACGCAYTVARSDGQISVPKVYRGENAVEMFLKDILQEEEKRREILATPKPLVMSAEDWEKHKMQKTATFARNV